MAKSKKSECPICGQEMDFIAVHHRNKPFVDGQTYSRMCFGCAHVPLDYIQEYDEDGNIVDEIGPYFSHKHLKTPQEMVEAGTCETLAEAKKCVAGVKAKIRAAGARSLNKLNLKRPPVEYEFPK